MKKWELVNFCEFDEYATKSYCAIHNEPVSKNLGDITKIDETKLEPFNMICGGSPCQDFSVAGKQKGSTWTCKDCTDENGEPFEWNPLTVHWSERDKCPHCGSKNIDKSRSSLLVEYLRVIRGNKPNFGIYENVKNIVGKQFKETTFKLFTGELEEYGYSVHYKVLNAKDYGVPQNRERVYLIFIKKELDNGKFEFPKPFDNGIRLKEILEDEVDEKFYISDDKVKKFLNTLKINEKIEDSYSPHFFGNINRPDFGTGYAGSVWSDECVSPTLTTMQGGGRQPHIVCGIDKSYNNPKVIEKANCITAREDRGVSNHKQEGTAVLECVGWKKDSIYNENGLSPTILSTSYKQPPQIKVSRVGNINPPGNGMNGNVFSDNGLVPTLTTNKGEGSKIFNGIRIRKLTPKECFRLMAFPDEAYESAKNAGVSNSQLYKQSGNAVVCDVPYYIYVQLYIAMPYLFDDLKLSSFFSGIGAFEIALNKLYEDIESGNFINPQVE